MSCIKLFYKLKAKADIVGYGVPVDTVDFRGVYINGELFEFDISDTIVREFELLPTLTIKNVLAKLKHILTHAIYDLDNVRELLVEDEEASRLCPNFTMHDLFVTGDFRDVICQTSKIIATELMNQGYDYVYKKDDVLYVSSLDGSKCVSIPDVLYTFFYNSSRIDKLPLMYYLIN